MKINTFLALFICLSFQVKLAEAGWQKTLGRPKSESSIIKSVVKVRGMARTHSDSELLKEVSNLTRKIENRDKSVHAPGAFKAFASAIVHLKSHKPAVAAQAEAQLAALEAAHSSDLRGGLVAHQSKYVQDVTNQHRQFNADVNQIVAQARAHALLDFAQRLPRVPNQSVK